MNQEYFLVVPLVFGQAAELKHKLEPSVADVILLHLDTMVFATSQRLTVCFVPIIHALGGANVNLSGRQAGYCVAPRLPWESAVNKHAARLPFHDNLQSKMLAAYSPAPDRVTNRFPVFLWCRETSVRSDFLVDSGKARKPSTSSVQQAEKSFLGLGGSGSIFFLLSVVNESSQHKPQQCNLST